MKPVSSILLIMLLLFSCSMDDDFSPDLNNPGLLPDPNDYLDVDYGTQDLAEEIAAAYSGVGNDSCRIGLVFYDTETRTVPLLYLTGAEWPVMFTPLESGALEFGYEEFQTVFMPLKMTTKTRILLELNATNDTIMLRGTGGRVRTQTGDGQPLGTPLPESDDAELAGFYAREDKRLFMLLDLMLPITLKAHINRTKE